MHFIIVDDSKAMRHVLQNYLLAMGVKERNILQCESGENAITAIKDITTCFVLLDWHLGGISGIDVLKILRTKAFVRMPILLITTEQKRKNIDAAIQCGADGYIIKPVDSTQFRQKILSIAQKYGYTIYDLLDSTQHSPQNKPVEVPKEEEKKISEEEWTEVQKMILHIQESGQLDDIEEDFQSENDTVDSNSEDKTNSEKV